MRRISFEFCFENSASQGVICGVDCSQFWLLSFFLDRYFQFNQYPITIFDFGLNQWQKSWIEAKFSLKAIECIDGWIKDASEVGFKEKAVWEETHGLEFWSHREKWFKKPFACIKSPYEQTVWLDLDCEVLGPINGLFEALQQHSLALALDPKESKGLYPIYNSGVIGFKKTAKVISLWAEKSLVLNDVFRGDQDLLSFLIHQEAVYLHVVSEIYNCSYKSKNAEKCMIMHWMGSSAKNLLREKIALSQLVKIS